MGKSSALPELATKLIYNFEHDSFKALADYVHRVADSTPPAPAHQDGILRYPQRAKGTRSVLHQWKQKFQEPREPMVEKFKDFESADLSLKFNKVRQTLNKDVQFTMLSNRVFTVEC